MKKLPMSYISKVYFFKDLVPQVKADIVRRKRRYVCVYFRHDCTNIVIFCPVITGHNFNSRSLTIK